MVALVLPILCKILVLPHGHSGVHSRFMKFRTSFLSHGDPQDELQVALLPG